MDDTRPRCDLPTDMGADYHDGCRRHSEATVALLEVTKAEVDKRWVCGANLWGTFAEASCILGCLGFARWGERFRQNTQSDGYNALEGDAVTSGAIEALATYTSDHSEANGDNMTLVYRQNDRYFKTKQDVKNFIDRALN